MLEDFILDTEKLEERINSAFQALTQRKINSAISEFFIARDELLEVLGEDAYFMVDDTMVNLASLHKEDLHY